MGKSAKLHKRVKKVKSGAGSSAAVAPAGSTSHVVQAAKKRSTLQGKAAKTASGSSKDGLLGGADYVDLMMGSRKKAKQEAKKLPSS
ncbi:hypothetical protein FPV67DRAFT_1666626 [Lyophyllum atratum]|nr:hypothetical protein FPV67DRAFT_1666626 [Lyophyllum atratum]